MIQGFERGILPLSANVQNLMPSSTKANNEITIFPLVLHTFLFWKWEKDKDKCVFDSYEDYC